MTLSHRYLLLTAAATAAATGAAAAAAATGAAAAVAALSGSAAAAPGVYCMQTPHRRKGGSRSRRFWGFFWLQIACLLSSFCCSQG